MTADAVVTALQLGPATLDSLAVRTGETDRDTLLWALEDARERGLIAGGETLDCGPDGLCSTGAPAVFRLA